VNGTSHLYQVYLKASPGFSGRVTIKRSRPEARILQPDSKWIA